VENFSPFGKPLREVEAIDLEKLRYVSEGWYVEYKREEPNASALAKSLAAFANTYGGWLFLGVEEESKEHAVAGSFPAVPREAVDACLQRIRKCAADHLNPTPHFETKVVWGPVPELVIPEDRAVICAWVPQSPAAPHVHKSGHIYRRVADGSEPRPENDRFMLDQMWRRGDEVRRFHIDWAEKDPEFSAGESECPFVRLMFTPDPWRQRDLYIDDEEAVRNVLQQATAVVSALPFDTVYTSADGFIGRQLTNNEIGTMGVTWRLRRDLVSDVIIPLQVLKWTNEDDLSEWLRGYEHVPEFIAALRRQKKGGATRLVDLNFLFNILIGVIEIQDRLLALGGWSEAYHFRTRLLGAWRTVPFLDVPAVMERFKNYGVPMCLDRVASFPLRSTPQNMLTISRHRDVENPIARVMLQTLELFAPLALSYGIPSWLDRESAEGVKPYYQELMEAGNKARANQGFRNLQS